MAVIDARGKGGGGLLGTLGGIATLGGALTGIPWLSALGMGLGAVNGASKGNTQDIGTIGKIMRDVLAGQWQKPTDGNIAKTNSSSTNNNELTEEDMKRIKSWSPYYTGGGYGTWQLM